VALSTGIQLAGPLTAFVFCVNLGLSLLGRMAPGLQLFFAVGPTITVAASFALMAISLPAILDTWYHTLPRGFEVLATLIGRGR
jgi:flagellar biosynthesis protein FliR